MASIIDSFKEVASDKLSAVKLLIFALPIYYCYTVYIDPKTSAFDFYCVALTILFFLLGFLVKITNNVINERNELLPSLNPLKLAFSSIKCLLATIIPVLISCSLANYISSFIVILPWVDIVLKTIIWLVVAAIVTSSFLMFSQRENILDAFKVKFLFEKAGDLIFIILFLVIKILLINALTLGFLGYAIYFLFGVCPPYVLYIAYTVVFNVAVIGHYMAQVNYESAAFGSRKNSN